MDVMTKLCQKCYKKWHVWAKNVRKKTFYILRTSHVLCLNKKITQIIEKKPFFSCFNLFSPVLFDPLLILFAFHDDKVGQFRWSGLTMQFTYLHHWLNSNSSQFLRNIGPFHLDVNLLTERSNGLHGLQRQRGFCLYKVWGDLACPVCLDDIRFYTDALTCIRVLVFVGA